jgi:gliding motility-associated-like protein
MLSSVSFVSAQCGPTQVDLTPQILGLCEGDSDTVNFAAVGTCSGNYEYQVETSTNAIVQPWSTNNQYVFSPTTTDTYTVYARCSACPTTVVSDTFLTEVIPEPTIVADDFVCYGTSANFTASGSPAGTMSWWDSPTGGTQLSTTASYNTPPLTVDDTVYMQVTGTITGGANQNSGSILITECGLEGFPGSTSADYLEISNVYSTAINTAGWTVAVSSSYSNVNSVNSTLWNLPASFSPCSILSKIDQSNQSNYWGSNIYWAANQPGWAAIVDDVGNLVDFIAWGWSAGQLAGFNVNINGFNITLGTEWTGNGCNALCQTTGGTPYSFSRTGNSDNNNAGDFTCQATSLNVINPGLSCGWVTSNITCPYPAIVVVDSLPTASAPDTTIVDCYAAVPAPDALIIDDESDDYTSPPSVQFMGEVSDGNLCPEILTRTYRVTDSCSNFIEVDHIIIINDTVAPTMEAAPADLNVSCYTDVPPMDSLDWADNCLGSGTSGGTEVSNGLTCPEVLTRTWTITDTCGNTATETQTITIADTIFPVIDPAPADLTLQCPSDLPAITSLNWTDNCAGNGVLNGLEVSDGQSCPETITRTWTTTDGCGNTSTEIQVIVINDDTPPTASNLSTLQLPVLPPADITLITDAADNCGTPVVEWFGDNSDNGFCPENVTRTYSVTDDCGNVTYVTRNFNIGDNIPNVSFTADPTLLDNFSSGLVEFDNNTTGAVTYTWDFGDNSPLNDEINPSHQFDISSSTSYDVWLVATSEFGCADSTTVLINVFQELVYYVPNAFTPDGDNLNPTFKPIFAAGFDANDYNLLIFNRWGEILFESNNHNVGWDGTYNGKVVQQGTYVYKIEFGLEMDDSRKVVTGHFTLLR